MDENQKLVQEFGKAIAAYMLGRARGASDLSELQNRVNEVEQQILSRMKVREPL